MSLEERDAAYLWDMLEYARHCVAILARASVSETDWHRDLVARLAIERSLELIGEAARKVSTAFQEKHPEVPWRHIIGQRNILAHDYGQLDYRQLYKTAKEDIPELIQWLEQWLPPLEEGA